LKRKKLAFSNIFSHLFSRLPPPLAPPRLGIDDRKKISPWLSRFKYKRQAPFGPHRVKNSHRRPTADMVWNESTNSDMMWKMRQGSSRMKELPSLMPAR
jgi:hypothetical protein